MSAAALQLTKNTLTVKRAPVASNGQIGNAAIAFADVPCGEFDSFDDGEVIKRLGLDTAFAYKQVVVFKEYAILTGDYVVAEGKERPVRSVSEWNLTTKTRRLILEDLKR